MAKTANYRKGPWAPAQGWGVEGRGAEGFKEAPQASSPHLQPPDFISTPVRQWLWKSTKVGVMGPLCVAGGVGRNSGCPQRPDGTELPWPPLAVCAQSSAASGAAPRPQRTGT